MNINELSEKMWKKLNIEQVSKARLLSTWASTGFGVAAIAEGTAGLWSNDLKKARRGAALYVLYRAANKIATNLVFVERFMLTYGNGSKGLTDHEQDLLNSFMGPAPSPAAKDVPRDKHQGYI